MSSMQRKVLTFALLFASAAAIGAQLAPSTQINPAPAPQAPPFSAPPAHIVGPRSYEMTPAPVPAIASAVERWRSLRQTDSLPFSSYASFLTSYRGWPGETAMRKTAERAINPDVTSPREVTSFFRLFPPLSNVGQARYAFALLAQGSVGEAQQAARKAWLGGVLPKSDEDRLLSLFGASLTPRDHDLRMEALLDNRDSQSAGRTLPLTSLAQRPLYEVRLALQMNAPDAGARIGMVAASAAGDAGFLMDQANWLRNGAQSSAARSLLAQQRTIARQPDDAEKWLETLLTLARESANDRNWLTAYQIAAQADSAFPAGTQIVDRSAGERDDYTSLTWLAGTMALQKLARPADAATMFLRYAKGGRSTQVLTKGLYWAGRAAQAAGQPAQAQAYFSEAAQHPELFYGQLALERLGRPVPAPPVTPAVVLTASERAAFQQKDLVQATRWLGQSGRWEDQSLFVRAIAEQASNERERALAAELGLQLYRPDLNVWLARNARNAGTPFYVRSGYPQVRVPPTQNYLWSLVHGITRQESSFDRAAVSPVGARGMMQLMPGTAREVSGKIGLSYDLGRLTRDPDYNVMLGSRYFETLMSYWGGSAPLAIASYNAGAGNVRKWVAEFGDPRLPGADIVSWIENIPFTETKGYVQRVLENAVVYDTINPSQARTAAATPLSYYLGKSGRPG